MNKISLFFFLFSLPFCEGMLKKITLLLFLFSHSLQAASEPSKKILDDLSLNDAIDIAFSRNLDLKAQNLSLESAKLSFDDAWDRMYLPSISLGLSAASSIYTVGTVPGTPARTPAEGAYTERQARSFGYPTSAATLTLGSYTLFNFWKDRIAYDISKMNFERTQQSYTEYRRTLKNQITAAYFQSKIDQDKIDAAKRAMDVSRAIVSLMKSRKEIGKANDDEVTSVSIDVINTKLAYDTAVKTSYDNLINFNILLNANVEQKYNFTTNLEFKPIKIAVDEAFKIFKDSSPSMKAILVALRTAEANLELQEKARLPLPTVSFNGVAVAYNSGYGTGSTSYPGDAGQLNLVTSMSLTLPLVGPGGIFNSRTVATTYIAKEQAELNATKASITGEVEVSKRISSIKNLETQILDQKLSYNQNTQLVDSLFSKMSRQNVSRIELRDAITASRVAQLAYLDATLQHLSAKNSFAELLGIDELPSDNISTEAKK